MEPIHNVDDRFTEGVWYDVHHGDFNRIERDEENGEVVFLDPESEEELERIPADDFTPEDMRRVSDSTVEDPVRVVRAALRIVSRNDINEMASIPMNEAIDLRYARQQTKIVEE